MLSPIEELKIQAKKLLKSGQSSSELLKLSNNQPPKLKHCQLLIAKKYGFKHWDHARQVLSGNPCNDYGTFWYKNQCATLLNIWCSSYAEAVQVLSEQGGTLLPYKSQFVIVGKPYLSLLGIEPDEPILQELQQNWCMGSAVKRQALALKRIQAW